MFLKSIAYCTCFLFVFTSASTQWVNVPTTIRTPNGNVKINTPMHMPMYRNYNYGKPNRKHEYTVVYLNDSTTTTKAILDISDSVHILKWGKKENQLTVLPSQTKEIYWMDEGNKVTGKPMDTCWVFLARSGKINTYSVTAEMDDPTIAFIQKGDGAILPLTNGNVEAMVKDNEKALSLAERKKLLRAIEVYNKE